MKKFRTLVMFINEMPLGTYSFTQNTTNPRINFRKFIGIPRAFSPSIIAQEWLEYDTNGSFEILSRENIDGQLVTTVKFNLTASENGAVVHQLIDVIVQTQL